MFDDVTIQLEATYVTAGGRKIEVFAESDDNTIEYAWQCSGCKTRIGSAARENRELALSSAQEHADYCKAV